MKFTDLDLEHSLQQGLARAGFSEPTPVQALTVPLALKGRDILASAQTGTGKTLAFGLPLIQFLLTNAEGTALVLAPTRELASQIEQMLLKMTDLKTALLIGGERYDKQERQLRKNPRLVIGTPGRIVDYIDQGKFKTSKVKFLVLDETDRMLDMGFKPQLEKIMSDIPRERQTLLFSATLPKNIAGIASKYLKDFERVSVGEDPGPAKCVNHNVLKVNEDKKYPELVRELGEREGSVIVFVKTKFGTERLAKKLAKSEVKASAIHGDLKQNKRNRVIQGLRENRFRVLVATDVVARGLDIPHVRHVINYDLPQATEDYVHRLGRTGRAGETGDALSFVTPASLSQWRSIEKSYYKTTDSAEKKPSEGGKKRPARKSRRRRPGRAKKY